MTSSQLNRIVVAGPDILIIRNLFGVAAGRITSSHDIQQRGWAEKQYLAGVEINDLPEEVTLQASQSWVFEIQ